MDGRAKPSQGRYDERLRSSGLDDTRNEVALEVAIVIAETAPKTLTGGIACPLQFAAVAILYAGGMTMAHSNGPSRGSSPLRPVAGRNGAAPSRLSTVHISPLLRILQQKRITGDSSESRCSQPSVRLHLFVEHRVGATSSRCFPPNGGAVATVAWLLRRRPIRHVRMPWLCMNSQPGNTTTTPPRDRARAPDRHCHWRPSSACRCPAKHMYVDASLGSKLRQGVGQQSAVLHRGGGG